MDIVSSIFGFIIGIVIGGIINGFVLMFVSNLDMGVHVFVKKSGFAAGFLIAIINGLIGLVWSLFGFSAPAGGIVGAIVSLAVAAGILVFVGERIPGFRVKGYQGALVAAAVMAAIGWGLGFVAGLFA